MHSVPASTINMGRTFIVASLTGLRGEANIIDQTVYAGCE